MLFNEDKLQLKSPIKWAGGKNFIIDRIRNLIEKNKTKKCFVECFAGSLALTLEFQPKKAIINDICFPLINMWIMIKDYPDELCKKLLEYSDKNLNKETKYNEIRSDFNNLKKKELDVERKILLAVYFIYLNRRGFNGLYRENSNGLYNVPYRKYDIELIYEEENIKNLSKYFNENDITFFCGNYAELKITKDCIVYLDPPYYPVKKTSFTQYNGEGFGIENQNNLLNFCKELDKKKIKFIQSNSPCTQIMELYSDFNKESFYMHRSMRSSKTGKDDKEKEDNEILIWN